jgi:multiple sugar transport system permease protein
MNPQVGVRRPNRFGRRERGFGQVVARQVQEVGIDPPVRCHASTVTTGHHKPGQRPL